MLHYPPWELNFAKMEQICILQEFDFEFLRFGQKFVLSAALRTFFIWGGGGEGGWVGVF